MLVLSLPHPFAFGAIAFSMTMAPLYYKTKVRGTVLIHAPHMTVPKDKCAPADFLQDWARVTGGWYETFQTDPPCKPSYLRMVELSEGILGMAEIVDCLNVSQARSELELKEEQACSWLPRTGWALVLRDSRPLPFTKCPGIAGIWDCQPRILKALGMSE